MRSWRWPVCGPHETRVALWNPSHRSRVNSGKCFDGIVGGRLLNADGKAAWWASLWFIWAVA